MYSLYAKKKSDQVEMAETKLSPMKIKNPKLHQKLVNMMAQRSDQRRENFIQTLREKWPEIQYKEEESLGKSIMNYNFRQREQAKEVSPRDFMVSKFETKLERTQRLQEENKKSFILEKYQNKSLQYRPEDKTKGNLKGFRFRHLSEVERVNSQIQNHPRYSKEAFDLTYMNSTNVFRNHEISPNGFAKNSVTNSWLKTINYDRQNVEPYFDQNFQQQLCSKVPLSHEEIVKLRSKSSQNSRKHHSVMNCTLQSLPVSNRLFDNFQKLQEIANTLNDQKRQSIHRSSSSLMKSPFDPVQKMNQTVTANFKPQKFKTDLVAPSSLHRTLEVVVEDKKTPNPVQKKITQAYQMLQTKRKFAEKLRIPLAAVEETRRLESIQQVIDDQHQTSFDQHQYSKMSLTTHDNSRIPTQIPSQRQELRDSIILQTTQSFFDKNKLYLQSLKSDTQHKRGRSTAANTQREFKRRPANSGI